VAISECRTKGSKCGRIFRCRNRKFGIGANRRDTTNFRGVFLQSCHNPDSRTGTDVSLLNVERGKRIKIYKTDLYNVIILLYRIIANRKSSVDVRNNIIIPRDVRLFAFYRAVRHDNDSRYHWDIFTTNGQPASVAYVFSLSLSVIVCSDVINRTVVFCRHAGEIKCRSVSGTRSYRPRGK